MSLLTNFFGDPNAREIKKFLPVIEKINAIELFLQKFSDEELKQKTSDLRHQFLQGKSLDELVPDAFALAREASRRTLGQRYFDVQLIGGLVLHHGMIAEMRTGEGKTLTATAPVYLNALEGKGVHVVTVNDYLARRDAVWMGQIYHALGLSVGCIQHAGSFLYDPKFTSEETHDEARDEMGSFKIDNAYLRPVSRREAYLADITYGTNNEFGFDYLRDNMAPRLDQMVQRELHYAIVDEVDSILIDEARTPLIISAPAEDPGDTYVRCASLVQHLNENEDYLVDEKLRAAMLSEAGIEKVEKLLNVENLYIQGGMKLVHHVESALRAHALYRRDRDYVVKDGEVIIVDEFTGRLMFGRRYSEGLHQAIEAKENVPIQRESVTLATITFQNLFRLYHKLAGMTGTAMTEAEEFHKIYGLEVVSVPTHRPNKRVDFQDRVYKTELGKFKALVRDVAEHHKKGQPVLLGTVSIEKNELLSALLTQASIPHSVLNAKQHEKEAEIIAQAGRKGAVTVATNMAGRGVDIVLGGNPADEREAQAVCVAGGLLVIGTERHESRRIDNQLRGRSGRQGDPGTTQFYVSMEDDLMRIFGSDRMKSMMDRMGVPEDEAIENKILSRSIEAAQKKVEGHHFDIRKHLLEYDDVLNKHRPVIYRKRREILQKSEASQESMDDVPVSMLDVFDEEAERLVRYYLSDNDPSVWDKNGFEAALRTMIPETIFPNFVWSPPGENIAYEKEKLVAYRTHLIENLVAIMRQAYKRVAKTVDDPVMMREIEKAVMLRSLDDLWIDHLENMDHLRHGVGLQGYGQRDPLVEYKREAYRLFHELLSAIQSRVAHTIFHLQISRETAKQELQQLTPQEKFVQLSAPVKEVDHGTQRNLKTSTIVHAKVGRNDPCPCGSGKKYKKCHGAG